MRNWRDILPTDVAIEQERYELRHRIKRAIHLSNGMSNAEKRMLGLDIKSLSKAIGRSTSRLRQHLWKAEREDKKGIRSPAEIFINESVEATALRMFPKGSVTTAKRMRFAETQITNEELQRGVQHLYVMAEEERQRKERNLVYEAEREQREIAHKRELHCHFICYDFYTDDEKGSNPWLRERATTPKWPRGLNKPRRKPSLIVQLAELRRINARKGQ